MQRRMTERYCSESAQDLWRETRLGEPTAGGIWDQVHARRQQRGVSLDPVCDDNTVWYMSNPVTPPNRGPRTRLMF